MLLIETAPYWIEYLIDFHSELIMPRSPFIPRLVFPDRNKLLVYVSMADVEIRRAVAEDKAGVLAINERILDGMDYIQAFYDRFVNSPVVTPYVATHGGEIVGFMAAIVADDGDTVVIKASRVKPAFAGRGCYKKLLQYAMTAAKARVISFMSDNTNKAIGSDSFQRQYTTVLSKPLLMYELDVNQIPDDVEYIKACDTMGALTQADLHHFFTSKTHRDYLFPENRIVVAPAPFRLLPSNISIIWQIGEGVSVYLSDVREGDGGIRGLVSVATTYLCSGGALMCKIDVFGKDCTSLKPHVAFHLDSIRKKATKDVVIMIVCDGPIASSIEETFKDYNLFKTLFRCSSNPSVVFETLHLFENKRL